MSEAYKQTAACLGVLLEEMFKYIMYKCPDHNSLKFPFFFFVEPWLLSKACNYEDAVKAMTLSAAASTEE